MGAENMSIHTLIYAINQGNKGLVGEILKHHPELSNACDTEGNRPLHVAAQAYSEAHIDHEPVYSDDECGDAQKRSDDKRGKQEEIMGLLLEHGAKPNGCNARGNTPVDILTQGAPFMMCVGTTNFRATTPAHLLLYEWRGKSLRNNVKRCVEGEKLVSANGIGDSLLLPKAH